MSSKIRQSNSSWSTSEIVVPRNALSEKAYIYFGRAHRLYRNVIRNIS